MYVYVVLSEFLYSYIVVVPVPDTAKYKEGHVVEKVVLRQTKGCT